MQCVINQPINSTSESILNPVIDIGDTTLLKHIYKTFIKSMPIFISDTVDIELSLANQEEYHKIAKLYMDVFKKSLTVNAYVHAYNTQIDQHADAKMMVMSNNKHTLYTTDIPEYTSAAIGLTIAGNVFKMHNKNDDYVYDESHIISSIVDLIKLFNLLDGSDELLSKASKTLYSFWNEMNGKECNKYRFYTDPSILYQMETKTRWLQCVVLTKNELACKMAQNTKCSLEEQCTLMDTTWDTLTLDSQVKLVKTIITAILNTENMNHTFLHHFELHKEKVIERIQFRCTNYKNEYNALESILKKFSMIKETYSIVKCDMNTQILQEQSLWSPIYAQMLYVYIKPELILFSVQQVMTYYYCESLKKMRLNLNMKHIWEKVHVNIYDIIHVDPGELHYSHVIKHKKDEKLMYRTIEDMIEQLSILEYKTILALRVASVCKVIIDLHPSLKTLFMNELKNEHDDIKIQLGEDDLILLTCKPTYVYESCKNVYGRVLKTIKMNMDTKIQFIDFQEYESPMDFKKSVIKKENIEPIVNVREPVDVIDIQLDNTTDEIYTSDADTMTFPEFDLNVDTLQFKKDEHIFIDFSKMTAHQEIYAWVTRTVCQILSVVDVLITLSLSDTRDYIVTKLKITEDEFYDSVLSYPVFEREQDILNDAWSTVQKIFHQLFNILPSNIESVYGLRDDYTLIMSKPAFEEVLVFVHFKKMTEQWKKIILDICLGLHLLKSSYPRINTESFVLPTFTTTEMRDKILYIMNSYNVQFECVMTLLRGIYIGKDMIHIQNNIEYVIYKDVLPTEINLEDTETWTTELKNTTPHLFDIICRRLEYFTA